MISETAFHGVRALSIEWQPVLKLCEASFRKKKEKKRCSVITVAGTSAMANT